MVNNSLNYLLSLFFRIKFHILFLLITLQYSGLVLVNSYKMIFSDYDSTQYKLFIYSPL